MINSKKASLFLIQLIFVFVSGSACTRDRTATTNKTVTNSTPAIGKECVTDYDLETDYFPDKINFSYSKGVTVDYHKHYKIVTVQNPWRDADVQFQYVLVQCGTPVPMGFDEAQIIQVPANTIVTLSTTHLPHLEKLKLLNTLIGVNEFKRINTAGVVEMTKQGKLVEVGSDANFNVELVLDLNPDLVMTYGSGNPEFDSYPKLLEAGLNVAINAEYMENTPLGRAEWLKFTALFFNREKVAEEVFGEIARKYEAIAAKTRKIQDRPTVLLGYNFNGIWYVPGGNSYVAQYLKDAGADYLWAKNDSTASLPLDFEVVLDRAIDADYWLNLNPDWVKRSQILSADPRYGEFSAVNSGRVFSNNARLNQNGGNDYWESGIVNPHLVLSDLIEIMHPDVLSEHELIYYRKLE